MLRNTLMRACSGILAIYVRCQNVNRPPPGTPTSTKKPAAKRRRIAADKHSYPSVCGDSEDEKTHEENVQSLKEGTPHRSLV